MAKQYFDSVKGECIMEATTYLGTVITADMCNGVLNEVLAMIPIIFPTMITFIGVRKGISFVQGILHSA